MFVPFAMPDGELAVALLREIRAKLDAIDNTLRGKDGNNGIVGRVGHTERSVRELREDVDGLIAQSKVKIIAPEPPETIRARAEAWAIRVGAGLAIFGFLIEVYQRLFGG